MVEQSARAVVMIRPARFFPNPETAADNAFQQTIATPEIETVSRRALAEFDHAIEALREAGVSVHAFDDTAAPEKPDAVFPNNWFSTHHDGRVVLYPMYSPARRHERRAEIIEELRGHYRVREVIDYSAYEDRKLYLEGTGSLVLDHIHRVAYVSLSNRAHREPLQKFCADFSFTPVVFESVSGAGRPIYHTNVMMNIGTDFAMAGLDSIQDETARARVRRSLANGGRELIELSVAQIEDFAGNALELQGEREKLLVLSERAAGSLTNDQRHAIERHARLLILPLPTIELAGGSARCMLATIHLPA